jgi:DNA-binding transcriptional LysR family regulator
VTPLFNERLHVAAATAHALAPGVPVTLEQLVGETFVGFDREVSPSLHQELRTMLGRSGVRYDPVIEATEYTPILGLVAASEGIAIVPASVLSLRLPQIVYSEINDLTASVPLVLLSRKEEAATLVLRALEVAAASVEI